MTARAVVVLIAAALLLSGCKSVARIAAVASGAAAGTATGSPAIGFAIGVGIDAAAQAGVQWFGRARAGGEQDAIADAAGGLRVGQRHAWRIRHTIPIGNEHGELYVIRQIETPWTLCKEIVFSVDEGDAGAPHRHWYDTSVCRQANGWKWAEAEPAVPRWGYLQ